MRRVLIGSVRWSAVARRLKLPHIAVHSATHSAQGDLMPPVRLVRTPITGNEFENPMLDLYSINLQIADILTRGWCDEVTAVGAARLAEKSAPTPVCNHPHRPAKPEQCEKSPHRPVEISRLAATQTIHESTCPFDAVNTYQQSSTTPLPSPL